MRLLRTAKAGSKIARLGKLSRTQRFLKIFRACKTLKIFRICRYFARTFRKVNDLFYKTICTFPSLIKMLNVIISLCYIYAIIGCELFYTDDPSHEDISKGSILGDFNSFPMAILALFQVLIGAD